MFKPQKGGALLGDLMSWMTSASRRRDAKKSSAIDDAHLFEQHEALVQSSSRTMSLLGGAGAKATQQRSALDGVRQHLHRTNERLRELKASAAPIKDALERIKLIAFNAGLEGARLGEPAGTPLLLVGEEVRALVERGLESTDAYGAQISQLESEREDALSALEQAQSHAQDIANELLSAQAAGRQLSDDVSELGRRVQRVTGTDPELAKHIAEAARHAEGLLVALGQLTSKNSAATALDPLLPAIAELKDVLRGLTRGDD
ncbi:MAG: methyl-accepting chemotaxis protein [Polyangiaceae bacterium]